MIFRRWKCIPSWLGGVVLLAWGWGCAPTLEQTNGGPPTARGDTLDGRSRMRQTALRHLVDGSILEAKGEHAQAILEYQDALRYDSDPALYYALSRNYSVLAKHSLAIESGKEAIRRAPTELTYLQNLADVYTAAFEYDSAVEQYEKIIGFDSSNINAWFNLAHLLQNRKPLKALEVYERLLNRFGPQWEVLLQVAQLNEKMGKQAEAAEALRQMTLLDPENKQLKESLAQTYLRAGKYDEALAVFTQLQEINPDNLGIQAEIAGIHLAQNKYEKAAQEFETILLQDTVSVELKLRIGELYFSQVGRDSTLAPLARSIYERITEKHPGDWRAYWFLGALGGVLRDDSLSVRSFRRVTELANWNADAWVYLSSVFLGKNNFSEVVTILESALRVVPDDFRVNFFLGFAYSRLGRNTDAARVLERSRQINPKDLEAAAQLALVYDGLKKFEESDRLYEECLQLDSTRAMVLNNYAYSLAERGVQLERALRMVQKALESDSANSSYLDTIGWVYFKLGRYREAEVYVKKAITKGEASAVVYEHLGDIYFMLNDRTSALEQWNLGLKLDETNQSLREKIARGSL